jgi:hypothetical protein
MRKLWLGLVLVGAITVSAAGAWAAQAGRRQIEVEYSNIKIAVNDQTISVGDSEPFIYVEQGRTFVPARPLAEALGAKVEWDGDTSTVQVYAKDFVRSELQGEQKVWTMPAQGFSITTPKGYYQQDLGLFNLTLAKVDFQTKSTSFVGVKRYDFGLPLSLSVKAAGVLESLRQTVLPDAALTDSKEADGKLTATGTATMFGTQKVTFTMRILPGATAGGDWILMTVTPAGGTEDLTPVLDSFTQL